MVEFAPFV